jgi:tetratricopeptide (TPR) repeat protein
VNYCSECGHGLDPGKEKFCSECGQKLIPNVEGERVVNRGITSPPIGSTGKGNIIGKEVGYTLNGNVLDIQLSDNILREAVDNLQRIISISSQIEQTSTISNDSIFIKNKDVKIQESTSSQQQIENVLNELDKIEEKAQTKIQQIKVGDLQISKPDLSLKEIILKGNEHYYKNEYNEAIESYDKAIKKNPYNSDLLANKGYALAKLGKYEEAIEYSDKAIKINPKYADAWNNKGYALAKLGKYEEALKCYGKAIEINPTHVIAKDSRDILLNKEKKKKGWFR